MAASSQGRVLVQLGLGAQSDHFLVRDVNHRVFGRGQPPSVCHYSAIHFGELGDHLEMVVELWETKAGALSVNDYLDIARAHRTAEDAAILKADRYLFCDTSAITTLLLGFCFGHILHAPVELIELADLCRTPRHPGHLTQHASGNHAMPIHAPPCSPLVLIYSFHPPCH